MMNQHSDFASIKPEWEDGSSKGSAILFKMGYRGKGLGKDGKGISKPIGVQLRPSGLGLGYNDFKEQNEDTVVDFDKRNDKDKDHEVLEDLELEEMQQRKSWTSRNKAKRKNKKKSVFKTVQESSKQPKKDVIIDMRDGSGRIYNAEQSGTSEKTKITPQSKYCMELQYNTRLLVDLVQSEIQNTSEKIRWKEETLESKQLQQEKIKHRQEELERKIQQSEIVYQLLERANENLCTTFKLEQSREIISSLRQWHSFLSEQSFGVLFEQTIIPSLSNTLRKWDMKKDFPDHFYFLQWFSEYPNHLEHYFTTLRQKFTKFLENEDIQDKEIHDFISIWYPVLKGHHYSSLLKRSLIPKLKELFSGFILNPADQKLDLFTALIQWRDTIPLEYIVTLLDEIFFPQFIKCLDLWLSNQPNYLEIYRWYTNWKKQFPPMILEEPRIISNFHDALLLMKKHLQPK